MKLEGKTAIITGGATGIGFACARAFVREGARVALFGRRQDRLNPAGQELGEAAITISGDMAHPEDTGRLVRETLSKFNSIDILVNNAGIFSGGPLHEMEDDQWNQVLEVNLNGVFRLTRSVLAQMVKQESGNLIHISSVLGMVAASATAPYNVSKAALNHFSRSLAVEYGFLGIRSNAICPGLIATEMTEELSQNQEFMDELAKRYPIGRFGVPEDVAEACVFLASDASSFITGAVLPVDGGYTAT